MRASALCAAAVFVAALSACNGNKGIDDPVNELPFGHVDIPPEGGQVKAETVLSGWAMDDRGVKQIRVYVDGHLINTGVLSQDRPDVSKAFPQYTKGTHMHGWTIMAGFDSPGQHILIVQAVDTDGATRDIGVVNVTAIDR